MIHRGARRPAESDRAREATRDTSAAVDARPSATGGQHRAVAEAALADNRLAVTLTVAELRRLIRDAALDAVADLVPAAPALLDRTGLARALGVGTSSVDRFRSEGMPSVWVGDMPRFELGPCLDWLRQRKQPERRAK